jgi:hypothetical protein
MNETIFLSILNTILIVLVIYLTNQKHYWQRQCEIAEAKLENICQREGIKVFVDEARN